jgi:hypothetical protein
MAAVPELSLTHFTLMRFITSMRSQVDLEVLLQFESFGTDVTCVWRLVRVCAHVFRHVARLCESLPTNFTLEWFLSSMRSHVYLEIASVRVQFTADLAFLAVVHQHVLSQF